MNAPEKRKDTAVRKRKDRFAEKLSTSIWQEIAGEQNPYLAESIRCHGYDVLELIRSRDYLDMFFLLFRGELPEAREKRLLEIAAMGLINPGPRHPATRAAITAAASKTHPDHFLSASLCVLSGGAGGSAEVSAAMKFLRDNKQTAPDVLASRLLHQVNVNCETDRNAMPGFGSHFGGRDPIPPQWVHLVISEGLAGEYLRWAAEFSEALAAQRAGLLTTGFAAAVFMDLGLPREAGGGLFQILCLPGILAHGAEFYRKPVTSVPFLSEEDYHVEP